MIDNLVYNFLISRLTLKGYGAFFERVSKNDRILDIGVGNGLMLNTYHKLIKDLELEILGVDLSETYLRQARRLIEKYELEDQMEVANTNFLYRDFGEQTFDRVFFSYSLPLIDEKDMALSKACSLLSDKGKIIVGQTIQSKNSKWLDFIKPKLKYLSTVDFGQVNYEEDFLALIERQNLKITDRTDLFRVNKSGSAQLIVLEPR